VIAKDCLKIAKVDHGCVVDLARDPELVVDLVVNQI